MLDQDLAARVAQALRAALGVAGGERSSSVGAGGEQTAAGGSPAFRDNTIPARFNAGFARRGSARRQERDCGLYTADRRQEREGEGKKGSESSLATLRNSGAVNMSRRRHGVDGEMATTREKEDTTTKRTTS